MDSKKISLAQALDLRKSLNSEIAILCTERNGAQRPIKYEMGDDEFKEANMPPRSLEDLTSLIEKKRSDLVLLQARIDAANTSFSTEWVEGVQAVSINQLWLMIQAARQEFQFSLYVSNDKVKVSRSKGQRRVDRDTTGKLIVVNDPDVFTEYPYDIEAQRERAKKLEAKIRVMNSVLQKANWIATIEVGDLDVTV